MGFVSMPLPIQSRFHSTGEDNNENLQSSFDDVVSGSRVCAPSLLRAAIERATEAAGGSSRTSGGQR
jgi:hypothetical protein